MGLIVLVAFGLLVSFGSLAYAFLNRSHATALEKPIILTLCGLCISSGSAMALGCEAFLTNVPGL